MLAATYPIQVLLMTLSGLVNRHQADVVAYRTRPGFLAPRGGIMRGARGSHGLSLPDQSGGGIRELETDSNAPRSNSE